MDNISGFRNSGVACCIKGCERCDRATEHAIDLVSDREKGVRWLFGCRFCGNGESIEEAFYEELYELSFEYDAWREGNLSFELFRESVPEALRGKVLEEARELFESQWKCVACGEYSPLSFGECWSCGRENPAGPPEEEIEPLEGGEALEEGKAMEIPSWQGRSTARVVRELPVRKPREKPEFLRMNGGITMPLGISLALGVLVAVGVIGLKMVVKVPGFVELLTSDWNAVRRGARFEPFVSGAAAFGLACVLGAWFSFSRFPSRISISARGIEVFGRWGGKSRLYGFDLVREARFTEEGNFLSLKFFDGRLVVVEMGRTTCDDLRTFFRGRF